VSNSWLIGYIGAVIENWVSVKRNEKGATEAALFFFHNTENRKKFI